MIKHKKKTKKVDNHDQRIQQVCHDGEEMIGENHPKSEEFQDLIANLLSEWANLKQAIEARRVRLDQSQQIQQYLFDCAEAEAWMGEQELYMMSDASSSATAVPPTPQQSQSQSQSQAQSQPGAQDSKASKYGKDELNAQNQLKKHLQLESEVEDHAEQIRHLGKFFECFFFHSGLILQ